MLYHLNMKLWWRWWTNNLLYRWWWVLSRLQKTRRKFSNHRNCFTPEFIDISPGIFPQNSDAWTAMCKFYSLSVVLYNSSYLSGLFLLYRYFCVSAFMPMEKKQSRRIFFECAGIREWSNFYNCWIYASSFGVWSWVIYACECKCT